MLHTLMNGRITAPAMDLRPSSHPRAHFVAQHVAGNLAPKMIDVCRLFRAWSYQTHIAS